MAVETAINRISANKTSDETRQIVRWDSGLWRHEDRQGGAEQAPMEQPEPLPGGGRVFLFSNHSHHEGIRRSGGYPPDVRNCILFANNADGNYLDYNDSGITWHCCLTDPNHLDQPKNDPHADGRGNIKTNPGFAYTYPLYGYFHLNWDSPCRDKGDSGNYPNEQDMDGQDRVHGIKVDIGADEVTCEDTSAPNDWNGDGVINYEEFAILSRAWLSCDPNTYPPPKDPDDEYIWYTKGWGFQADLNNDSCVDLADLTLFCDPDNWLWTACWQEDYWDAWGMIGGSNGESMMKSMPGFEATSTMAVQSAPMEEKTVEQQILNLEEIIEFLEKIWLNEPDIQEVIKPEAWQEFMNAVYNGLFQLQTGSVQYDW